MTMGPASPRVNSAKNDDLGVIEPTIQADAAWPPDGDSA